MLNTFASLQHINQFDFQAAWEILSDNLTTYPDSYDTKEEFVAYADEICNQFPDEEPRLSKEDNEAIASKVWDEKRLFDVVYAHDAEEAKTTKFNKERDLTAEQVREHCAEVDEDMTGENLTAYIFHAGTNKPANHDEIF